MSNPTTQPQSKLKQGVIRLNIEDLKDLYQFYMPFVDGCGIFVATEERYTLEQEVFVFLKLPGDLGKFAASGRVVWLNPPKKISKRVPGVGIQLKGKEAPKIREVIEAGLGKMMSSGLPSATL
ncbi:MAG: pilus assembly protein PilZ [Cardiobacteriaceae bacterium]|nr:pilus assembly protein PilZ [Cardiobacteriaceae bacterium]